MAVLISLDAESTGHVAVCGVRCIRKYTATRSLGRPSELTECPATSFGKISLNHECQAEIECRYMRSWRRYPVRIRGSTLSG